MHPHSASSDIDRGGVSPPVSVAESGRETRPLRIWTNCIPFNQTLKYSTWQAAGSRPYGGVYAKFQFLMLHPGGGGGAFSHGASTPQMPRLEMASSQKYRFSVSYT